MNSCSYSTNTSSNFNNISSSTIVKAKKCKDAAKQRRESENAEFNKLAKLLPISMERSLELDKASIIKLTTSFLRLRELFSNSENDNGNSDRRYSVTSDNSGMGFNSNKYKDLLEPNFCTDLRQHLFQSLNGFLITFTPDGKITYVSEPVSTYLGYSQLDLIGENAFDFIHPSDHDELNTALGLDLTSETNSVENLPLQETNIPCQFSLRMKCVLPKRTSGITFGGYKVIHFNGHLKLTPVFCNSYNDSTAETETDTTNEESLEDILSNNKPPNSLNYTWKLKKIGLIAIGFTIPFSPGITEIKMYSNMFMFRSTMDLKLNFIDSNITNLTGYEPTYLIDKTLYQFVHPEDALQVQYSHRSLCWRGQAVTKYYRFFTKNGGWLWIQSYATVVHNSRSSRPYCIISINYVLSNTLENAGQSSSCQILPNVSQSDDCISSHQKQQQSLLINFQRPKRVSSEDHESLKKFPFNNVKKKYLTPKHNHNLQEYPTNFSGDNDNISITGNQLEFCGNKPQASVSFFTQDYSTLTAYPKHLKGNSDINYPCFAHQVFKSNSQTQVVEEVNEQYKYNHLEEDIMKYPQPHQQSQLVNEDHQNYMTNSTSPTRLLEFGYHQQQQLENHRHYGTMDYYYSDSLLDSSCCPATSTIVQDNSASDFTSSIEMNPTKIIPTASDDSNLQYSSVIVLNNSRF